RRPVRVEVDVPEARLERRRLAQLVGEQFPAEQGGVVGPAEALAVAEQHDLALRPLAPGQELVSRLYRQGPVTPAAGRWRGAVFPPAESQIAGHLPDAGPPLLLGLEPRHGIARGQFAEEGVGPLPGRVVSGLAATGVAHAVRAVDNQDYVAVGPAG